MKKYKLSTKIGTVLGVSSLIGTAGTVGAVKYIENGNDDGYIKDELLSLLNTIPDRINSRFPARIATPSNNYVQSINSYLHDKKEGDVLNIYELGIAYDDIHQVLFPDGVYGRWTLAYPFDRFTNEIIVTFSIYKGKSSVHKNVVIVPGFDFSNDLAKIHRTTQSSFNSLSSIKPASLGDITTTQALGITEPHFSPGVTVTYEFENEWSERTYEYAHPHIRVTLHKGNQTTWKFIRIISAQEFDFTNDLALIPNKTRSSFTDLSNIPPASQASLITAQELGITEPHFSPGVTASYRFDHDWDGIHGHPHLRVLLHKGNENSYYFETTEIIPAQTPQPAPPDFSQSLDSIYSI